MHTIAAVKLRAPVSSAGRVLLVLAVLAGGASAEPITVYDAFGDGDTFLAASPRVSSRPFNSCRRARPGWIV
jgi:hypothetical protein